MKFLRRYLATLRLFWATSIGAEMEYRANFTFAAIGSAGGLAANLFGLSLFFGVEKTLGDWSWDQALLVLGLFTAMSGASAAVLSPNLSRIVRHVELGTLDFVLLKPMDSQFWLSTRNLSLWGLPDVALGLGLVVFALVRLHIGPAAAAGGLLPIALGLVVLYSLWFILGTTCIWFVKIYNVTEVLRALLDAGRFPITAYPAGYQFFFKFIVPVAFMTSVPAEVMIGRAGATTIWSALGIAAALLAFSRWFWRFALRFYTSASS